MHPAAPWVLYDPARHWFATPLVDLMGHQYPAVQSPSQAADAAPLVLYLPAGQSVQLLALPTLY